MYTATEITAREVIGSQLAGDDLRGLAAQGPSVPRCKGIYCESNYDSEKDSEEPQSVR